MKKVLSIFALIVAIATIVPSVSNAQTFIRLKQGQTADTLKASTTYTTTTVNVSFPQAQLVVCQLAIDSVSGNPAGTFTLEESTDGTHWDTSGQTWTFTSSGTGTHSKTLSVSGFLGAFLRVKAVTTSTTQKSKYWISIKTFNVN